MLRVRAEARGGETLSPAAECMAESSLLGQGQCPPGSEPNGETLTRVLLPKPVSSSVKGTLPGLPAAMEPPRGCRAEVYALAWPPAAQELPCRLQGPGLRGRRPSCRGHLGPGTHI